MYGMDYDDETIALVALLHDVCKINVYKTSYRNKKVNGEWQQVPYYEFEDDMPYGHGEKSVYMISPFMKLTREEALLFVITWDFPMRIPLVMLDIHLNIFL